MLYFLPRGLRRDSGDEMTNAFLALAREAYEEGGSRALLGVWAHAIWDVTTAALRRARGGRQRRSPRGIHAAPQGHTGAAGPAVESMLQDVRYAVRVLLETPAFAVAAVLTVAIGVGANTAIFSLVDAVILRPLPFEKPDRLMAVWEQNPERGWYKAQVAAANYLDWQAQSETFVDMAAHNDWLIQMALTGDGEPEMVFANEVTGNFFSVLGVQPLLGRDFRPEETWATGEPVVMLSHGFWNRRYGGDPSIVGSELMLDGTAREVAGIMPRGFAYPFPDADMWAPVAWDPARREQVSFRRAHGMSVIGRLREGVTREAAEAEMATIADRLQQQYPETNTYMGNGVTPLHEWVVGNTRRPLLLLLSAVGFVLLIACANVANMLLARSTARAHEMAVRNALGATRLRLVRQGLTESLAISVIGGALGFALAVWATDALVALSPADLPRTYEVEIDTTLALFSFVVTMLAGLLFGAVPAWRSARPDVRRGLTREGRGNVDLGARSRAVGLLVIAEIALALPLVAGAGLMARTLAQMHDVDPGFDASNTLAVGISLPAGRYAEGEQVVGFYRQLLDSVRELPGVVSAATSTRLPFAQQRWTSDFTAEDWPPGRFGINVRHDEISSRLFETLRVPMIRGRSFTRADDQEGPLVAVINRALAERYFPDRDPVGVRICFDREPDESSYWFTIVGVSDNVRRVSLASEEEPSVYAAITQDWTRNNHLLVRASSNPEALVEAVRGVVHELDPELPLFAITTLEQLVSESVAQERFLFLLLSLFAAVALLLSSVGVYGVVAYSVSRRTAEIGVRMALGARRADVLRTVVGQGMLPVIVGIAIGLPGALLAARLMASLLFEVATSDPLTFAGVCALLLVVGLTACYLPARRATKVNPVIALRW
jgi:putative ABC transport system permease protein